MKTKSNFYSIFKGKPLVFQNVHLDRGHVCAILNLLEPCTVEMPLNKILVIASSQKFLGDKPFSSVKESK